MSLPLGHLAVGILHHDLSSKKTTSIRDWKTLLVCTILANLPDLDVVVGLLVAGNGNAFHRGPSHSLIFALLMGIVAARLLRYIPGAPKLSSLTAFLVILSHLFADILFTASPVSFFWPFEVNLSVGFSSTYDIVNSVIFQAYQDVGVILVCIGLIYLNRLAKRSAFSFNKVFAKLSVYWFSNPVKVIKKRVLVSLLAGFIITALAEVSSANIAGVGAEMSSPLPESIPMLLLGVGLIGLARLSKSKKKND